jgi:hypothetical protein
LGYRKCLRLFHLEEALGAIVAHAGHENPEGAGTRGLCDGAEQYIDAGPVTRNKRPFADFEKISRTDAVDKRVAISGGYVSAARDHSVAMRSFSDLNSAYSIESPCERGRKTFGHMLHDDDSKETSHTLFHCSLD